MATWNLEMAPTRVNIDLTPDEAIRFDRLRKALNIKDPEDVLALALVLLDWAADRSRLGEHIASMSPDFSHYRRFPLPDLEALRVDARVDG
jgi:hypothetical protein